MQPIRDAAESALTTLIETARHKATTGNWHTQNLLNDGALKAQRIQIEEDYSENSEKFEELQEEFLEGLFPTQQAIQERIQSGIRNVEIFGIQPVIDALQEMKDYLSPEQAEQSQEIIKLSGNRLTLLNRGRRLKDLQHSILQATIPAAIAETCTAEYFHGLGKLLTQASRNASTDNGPHLTTRFYDSDRQMIASAGKGLPSLDDCKPQVLATDHLERMKETLAALTSDLSDTHHWTSGNSPKGKYYVIESPSEPLSMAYLMASYLARNYAATSPQQADIEFLHLLNDGEILTEAEYDLVKSRNAADQNPPDISPEQQHKLRLVLYGHAAEEVLGALGIAKAAMQTISPAQKRER